MQRSVCHDPGRGGARVDDRLDHLAAQVDQLRRRIDERFDAQDARMDRRFDLLQNAMIITLASILAAFGGLVVALQLG